MDCHIVAKKCKKDVIHIGRKQMKSMKQTHGEVF